MYRMQTVIALFVFGVTLASAAGFAMAWFSASRRARRLERHAVPDGTEATDARTERMEQAIESLAMQMDQLASGQEFLNRILSERIEKVGRLKAPEPELTPH